MKTLATFALVVTTLLVGARLVLSQDFKRADHKINGGRVRSNQRHAQDEALELFHLSQVDRPVQKDEFLDFTSTIKHDLGASEKSLAKFEAEARKVKEASELIDSIKKHHARAGEQVALAEKAFANADTAKSVIGGCAGEIYHELGEAQDDTQKLFAVLKLDNLAPPKKKA